LAALLLLLPLLLVLPSWQVRHLLQQLLLQLSGQVARGLLLPLQQQLLLLGLH
jgi:hypothetical protein